MLFGNSQVAVLLERCSSPPKRCFAAALIFDRIFSRRFNQAADVSHEESTNE